MTVNLDQFAVSAPGKVILFGEHAAVYDKPAIAAAIALRTYMLVTPSSGSDKDNVVLEFPDIKLRFSYPVKDLPWDSVNKSQSADLLADPTQIPTTLDDAVLKALEPLISTVADTFQHVAILAFFYLYLHICTPEVPPCTFVTKSTLPVGAGLGSSATFAVCLSSAFLTLSQKLASPASQKTPTLDPNSNLASPEHEIINRWAFIGEKCLHGTPSGIDNTVACRGGAVLFQRPSTLISLQNFPELKLILTNTKHPRRTAELVARVGDMVKTFEKGAWAILDAIEHVTREAFELLGASHETKQDNTNSPEVSRLLELVRINHGLLVSLGVSHPKLERIRSVGNDLNIGETKLTGAGGGGCAITLLHVNDEDDELTQAEKLKQFRSKLVNEKVGFEIFDTVLGGPGCGFGSLAQPITLDEFHGLEREQLETLCAWQYWQ